MHVSVAVVGRGMIGSAAARHLAESGIPTALIGPLEATDRKSSPGPFASHHDQGRITRVFGRTPEWSTLAARSIGRYADIATRSGIDFYLPSGCVAMFDGISDWVDNAKGFDLDVEMIDPESLAANTGIVAPTGVQIAIERSPAGQINPRRLVMAQARLASMAGAESIEEAVVEIGRSDGRFSVETRSGSLTADRVLLATGAFGSELIDGALDLERRARTILLAEMPAIAGLPTVISASPDQRLNEIYWIPPVRYPNGRTYLKIGGDIKDTRVLEPGELIEWFHGDGAAAETDALENSLRALLPGEHITSLDQAPCVITATPTGHPYIGWVDDGIAVALGGSGSAAKSSDELGRLASTLFSPAGWSDDLDAAVFAPQWR